MEKWYRLLSEHNPGTVVVIGKDDYARHYTVTCYSSPEGQLCISHHDGMFCRFPLATPSKECFVQEQGD